jgi:hypothetical protein
MNKHIIILKRVEESMKYAVVKRVILTVLTQHTNCPKIKSKIRNKGGR